MPSTEDGIIKQLKHKIETLTENPDYKALSEKYFLLEAELTITKSILAEKKLLEPIAHAALDLIEGYNRWTYGDTVAKFEQMVEAAVQWGKKSEGYLVTQRVTLKGTKRYYHRGLREFMALEEAK